MVCLARTPKSLKFEWTVRYMSKITRTQKNVGRSILKGAHSPIKHLLVPQAAQILACYPYVARYLIPCNSVVNLYYMLTYNYYTNV